MSNRRYIKQRITEPKLKLSSKQIKELEQKFNALQENEDKSGETPHLHDEDVLLRSGGTR